MSFVNLNTVTVTGTYVISDGTAAAGTVSFVPAGFLADSVGNQLIAPSPVTVTLDGSGHFSVSLPATDDPDINPVGWTYTVTEAIAGSPPMTRSYSLSVPVATVGSLDLADVVPVTSSSGTIGYVVVSSIITAKGDLIAGTGSGALGRVAVGADGLSPVADSTASAGVSYDVPLAAPAWVTSRAYKVGQLVWQSSTLYRCATAHTSGTFATDLAAVKWVTVSSSGASSALTPTATKTANYTAVKGDLVPANATGGGFTVTLPASPTAGDTVGVYKTDSSANVVTVAGTIDGQTNATIVSQNAGATFEYVGAAGWKVIAQYSSVGPTGPTGPSGPMGGSGVQPIMADGAVGQWYGGDGLGLAPAGNSNQTLAAGTLSCGVPRIAQEDITIDQLGCYVQTGGVGASVRLGIYAISATNPFDITLNSPYATLLVDGGTVAATSNATRATVTLGTPVTIPKGTAFVVVVAAQGGVPGIYHESLSNSWQSPWGSSSILNGVNASFRVTGVTGALPTTLTPTAFATASVGGAGWYRRSA